MKNEERPTRPGCQWSWIKRFSVLCVSVFAVVVLVGQGMERPVQHILANSLTLNDESGQARVKLGIRDGASFLELIDKFGIPRALLVADLEGETTMFLKDGAERERIVLTVHPDGPAHLMLRAKEGRGLVSAYVDIKGRGFIIEDKGTRTRAVLETAPDGSTSMELRDKDGKIIWRAPPK